VYDEEELKQLFGAKGDGVVDEIPSGDELVRDDVKEFRRRRRDGEVKRVRGRDGKATWVDVPEFVGRKPTKVGKGNDGKALNFVQRERAGLVYRCDRPTGALGKECSGDVIDGACLRCKKPFRASLSESEAESGGDD
jgi:hypothetical protein